MKIAILATSVAFGLAGMVGLAAASELGAKMVPESSVVQSASLKVDACTSLDCNCSVCTAAGKKLVTLRHLDIRGLMNAFLPPNENTPAAKRLLITDLNGQGLGDWHKRLQASFEVKQGDVSPISLAKSGGTRGDLNPLFGIGTDGISEKPAAGTILLDFGNIALAMFTAEGTGSATIITQKATQLVNDKAAAALVVSTEAPKNGSIDKVDGTGSQYGVDIAHRLATAAAG